MSLTNEHVGPKILAKIKIYVLTRTELLFQFCYEIPCRYKSGYKSVVYLSESFNKQGLYETFREGMGLLKS